MADSVSVIIPTWNRVKSLERAILSCLSQSVPVKEVLVCDDGSTDGTEQMVKTFGDPRVKWCPGGHVGRPAVPRNRGLHVSSGEWVAFLDDDDEWFPEKIEKQLALAEKMACSAVCSNAYRLLPNNEELGLLLKASQKSVSFSELLQLNQVICSSVMIRREIFCVVEGFPENPHLKAVEDYSLWLRVATQTNFAFVDEPLVRYFDDPHNSIRSDNNSFVQTCNVYENFLDWSSAMAALKPYAKLVKVRLGELKNSSLKARFKVRLNKFLEGTWS